MRAFLRCQRGSSTVLITLLMVTLVVFGLLSLTTTASELKLAKRNAESHKDYYALDSEGVKFVAHIKLLIDEACLISSDNLEGDFYTRVDQLLERDLPYVRRELFSENGRKFLRLTKAFALENGGYNKVLDITLEVTEPRQPQDRDDSVAIMEWRLWQEPFEYDHTEKLWEGLP